jgi:hypothetical protein
MHKHDAIYQLNPTVVTINDEVAYDADGNEVTYDNDAVELLMSSKSYIEDRSREYPSIQEQLDMQYWDGVNGTTTWSDAIAEVKASYPKPE